MNNVWRIASWQDRAAARSKEAGVALVRIETPAGFASSHVLVTPNGYRVEGLTLEQLSALLRELA